MGLRTADRKELVANIRRLRKRAGGKACSGSALCYKALFEYSPVALWEMDLSAVKKSIDALKSREAGDLKEYLSVHKEEVSRLIDRARTIDINTAAVKFYHASGKKDFHPPLSAILREETRQTAINMAAAFDAGQTFFTSKARTRTFEGEERRVMVRASILPGSETTWDDVLVFVLDITGQERFAELLREREKEYREVVENANSIIIKWGPDGIISFANPFACTFFGGDLMGSSVLTLYPREQRSSENMQFLLADIMAHPEKYVNMEQQNVRRNDEPVWVAWTTRAIPDGDGIRMILSIGNDITPLKKAEQAVRKSEQDYRALSEHSPDYILRFDRSLRYLYLNSAARDMPGYRGREVIGKTDRDLGLLSGLVDFLDRAKREVFDTRRAKTIEFSSPVEGSEHNFLCSIVPEFGTDARVETVLVISRDITELKQVQRELAKARDTAERRAREAEDEKNILEAIMEYIPEGLTIVDAVNGTIRIASRYAADLLGLEHETIRGMSLEERARRIKMFHLDGDTPAQTDELPVTRVTKRGEVITNEEWKIKRGGKVFTISACAGPIRDEQQRITGGVISWRDITERKRAEEQIKYVSFHDRTTRLYNRTYFEEELDRLDTSREMPLSIIMGDMNHLKLVNDAFGHREGDRLLAAIADILRFSVRDEDIVARWGGDEFIILLPRTPVATATEVARRITKECRRREDFLVPLSIALGITVKEDARKDVEESLREAEDNMYRAKLVDSVRFSSEIIARLLKASRDRGYEDRAHVFRLNETARLFGERLGLSGAQIRELRLLTVLHDIGEIGVPAHIVLKRGSLNRREWELMQRHVDIGYRIVKSFDTYAHVADEILEHHEHWDGSGYPKGLSGEEIPFLARIFSILDAYDCMTHVRSYKPAVSPREAMVELRRRAGTQFDPHLVSLFLAEKINVPEKELVEV